MRRGKAKFPGRMIRVHVIVITLLRLGTRLADGDDNEQLVTAADDEQSLLIVYNSADAHPSITHL